MITPSSTLCLIVFTITFSRCLGGEKLDQRLFPRQFKWGVATASYQIEGAWNVDGKGVNIWDSFTHEHPEKVYNESNGDIACDSYNKFEYDIKLLKNLGVHFYRFSISWARLIPTGRVQDGVNLAGIEYYKNLIERLLKNNIEPYVTLFHWDLPQYLQDTYGGWPNPILSDFFAEYARVAFSWFPLVKTWITINEPMQICNFGYGNGIFAPGITESGTLDYQCTKTVLIAHAKAYRLFRRYYGPTHGKVGMAIHCGWYEPGTKKARDITATNRMFEFNIGIFAKPIYGGGDWPEVVKEFVATRSKMQGLPTSRLPSFTDDELQLVKGTYDFFGMNYYTAAKIADADWKPLDQSSWENDIRVKSWADPSWPSSASDWLKVVPYGIRKNLKLLKQHYGDIEFMILENGYSDRGEQNDVKRSNYYLTHFNQLLAAIHDDGVKLSAYTAWSLLDNFEWWNGYWNRFGIYSVDFTDPHRTRSEKLSASVYQSVVSNNQLPLYTFDE